MLIIYDYGNVAGTSFSSRFAIKLELVYTSSRVKVWYLSVNILINIIYFLLFLFEITSESRSFFCLGGSGGSDRFVGGGGLLQCRFSLSLLSAWPLSPHLASGQLRAE